MEKRCFDKIDPINKNIKAFILRYNLFILVALFVLFIVTAIYYPHSFYNIAYLIIFYLTSIYLLKIVDKIESKQGKLTKMSVIKVVLKTTLGYIISMLLTLIILYFYYKANNIPFNLAPTSGLTTTLAFFTINLMPSIIYLSIFSPKKPSLSPFIIHAIFCYPIYGYPFRTEGEYLLIATAIAGTIIILLHLAILMFYYLFVFMRFLTQKSKKNTPFWAV